MKYYLGIDNGGSLTKAALYDEKGKQVALSSQTTEMITPAPDFCERDMEEMWSANCKNIRNVIESAGINAKDIAAVACCGHGKGLYLWGKDNKPAYNGILSTDNRAWRYPMEWKQNGVAKEVFGISCQSILACQPVALLAWLRDNETAVAKNTKYIFACKDYVRFRLTGEAYGEITDFSGCNFLNLHTRGYDRRLFELMGIETFYDCLPPIKNSTDICGYVTAEAAALTGLCEGTPVAGGMFDIDACAVAVGAADERRICMIAGTWSINEYIRSEPVTDGTVALNSLFCDPRYFLIEESSPTSAGNNQWYMKTLMPEVMAEAKKSGRSGYAVADEWVSSLEPDEFCPVFLPFVLASNVHPNAKGTLIGICANHTRAHITKAIYEGIAFGHRYHLEKLLRSRTMPVECIRLAGGVTNSRVWVQMFADVCGLPVETANVAETGAFGCALAAAVAVGDYKDFESAASLVDIGERVMPRKEYAESYNRKYALYIKAIESLDGFWDSMRECMG